MRFLTFLLTLFFIQATISISAQNCSAWKKAHCDSDMSKYCKGSAAIAAAIADGDVLMVNDEVTGERRYVRKMECASTGSITYQNVIFSSERGAFICDMSKCDLSKCDLSKCDISKCNKSVKGSSATALIIKKRMSQVRT
ncbi:MAG: hypothetical protein OEQ53_07180 [Saprospiraceae bacterium]|nr:hypothetical protein [Saprospiraceae bacterium]